MADAKSVGEPEQPERKQTNLNAAEVAAAMANMQEQREARAVALLGEMHNEVKTIRMLLVQLAGAGQGTNGSDRPGFRKTKAKKKAVKRR
jgi:hypothetical protein